MNSFMILLFFRYSMFHWPFSMMVRSFSAFTGRMMFLSFNETMAAI